MTPREGVPLAPLTTFGIGGVARSFVEVRTEEELQSVRASGFFILGGGSNVLAPDDVLDALVIRISIPGIEFEEIDETRVRVVAGAGHPWDSLVEEAAKRGLWGVENLAGIPGSVGGAVVQNIGAYGAELSTVFDYANTIDIKTGVAKRLMSSDLSFGYRDSRFKKEPALAITRVALILQRPGTPNLVYADLARAKERGEPLATPEEIGMAVRNIRAGKFPDLSKEGTAGSFFKNPVLTKTEATRLKLLYPDLPQFSQADERVKISLAWILDHVLSLKGFSVGGARLFEKQPLVIAVSRNASSKDVEDLAHEIERRVHEKVGISIEREVIHMHPHFS